MDKLGHQRRLKKLFLFYFVDLVHIEINSQKIDPRTADLFFLGDFLFFVKPNCFLPLM